MERIKKTLEKLGYGYDIEEQKNGTWYGLVEFWTNTAGQDIPTEIEFDGTAEDFVKQFCQSAENYDVDEEVSVYVSQLGKRGVPDTVGKLLDDCQEAKGTLMRIAKALQYALTGEYKDIPSLFDIALIEKPGTEGLTKSNVIDLFDMLEETEAYPIEIGDVNGNSSAMGFITPQAAEKLNYEYDQDSELGQFISSILDCMREETDDGIYKFKDLNIWLSRD